MTVVLGVALGTGGTAAAQPTPRRRSVRHGGSARTVRPARAASAVTITVDGRRAGPAFQGVGAISGGGGNSRFLVDYPARQREAILKELFAPKVGAALQLLKLEIGGDANSSDGAEPSVEQVPGRVDCHVGYELWLARQALRLDPHLVIYGLQWAAPAWVRGRGDTVWTSRDIRYLLAWLGCARRAGVPVRYLGGWNEHYTPGSPAIERWFVHLRAALDAHGYRSVVIVATDTYSTRHKSAWAIAANMAQDPALARAVGVIGIHDACGAKSQGFACRGSALARELSASRHTLLWQSELGRMRNGAEPLGDAAPAALARDLNAGFLDARLTATLLWPLVDAMPAGLPYAERGLVSADQPWSGHFHVSPLVAVVAQTTQFTEPGWHFVDGANGQLPGGGSFVTYERPGGRAWSMVVQTSTARRPIELRLHLVGGLATTVRLWRTGLADGPALVEAGQRRADAGGWLAVRLPPRTLTTITTLAGRRPDPPAGIPPSAPLRLPYHLAPDRAGMARLLAPMEGSFQYVGRTLTQTTVQPPVPWDPCPGAVPYAVVGGRDWHDDEVRAVVKLPPTAPGARNPGAFVLLGFTGYRQPCRPRAEELRVTRRGTWRLVRSGPVATVLAAGRVAPAARYRLQLAATGRRLVVRIDGRLAATTSLPAPVVGLAGLGALGYYPVRYERFSVRRLSTAGSSQRRTG